LIERLPHTELLSMESNSELRRKWSLIGKTKGFDLFFHLAWNVNSSSWRETPSQRALIRSTGIFLETVKNFGPIISTGTCQEYLPQSVKLKENSELAYDCNYVLDKHDLHNLLKEYSINAGNRFSWVRLFNIYGPGDHPNRIVSLLLKAAVDGKNFQLDNPLHAIDLLHIEDAIAGLIRIASNGSKETYNLGSGIAVTPEAIKQYMTQVKLKNFDVEPTQIFENAFESAHIADIDSISRLGWQPQHSLSRVLLNMLRESEVSAG